MVPDLPQPAERPRCGRPRGGTKGTVHRTDQGTSRRSDDARPSGSREPTSCRGGARVALPVARDDQGCSIPQGLPADVLGGPIPIELDTAWAAAQGFEATPGQSLALRATRRADARAARGSATPRDADAEVWRERAPPRRALRGARPALAFLLPLPSTIPTDEVARAGRRGRAARRRTESVAPRRPPRTPAPSEVVARARRARRRGRSRPHERRPTARTRGEVIAGAVCWARDLINRPAAQLTPRRFAHEALRRLEDDPNVTIEIWRDAELEAERLRRPARGVARLARAAPTGRRDL